MTAKYDNRRFRTTRDLVIPAGTLVVPTGDGRRGEMNDGSDDPLTAQFPLEEAEHKGMIRLLADGEA